MQYKFKQLLSQAKEFKFWEYNAKRGAYAVNNGKLLQFLHYNGFYNYMIPQMDNKTKRAVEERIFIQIKENIIEKFDNQSVVYDSVLNFSYFPFWKNDSMYVMEFRFQGKDTLYKHIEKIDFIVGSGHQTRSR